MPIFRHPLPVGNANNAQTMPDHGVQRRGQLHGLVDLGQHHALAGLGAPGAGHVLDRLALLGGVDHQDAADARVGEHLEQLVGAAVALGHAGGVDQHHLLARQQLQQVLQRGPVVRGVHRHAEDAAVGAKLLVGTDAVGIQRDEAQLRGTVPGGEGRGDLGGGGGLAHAGRADQGEDAALLFQRRIHLVGDEVAGEHLGGPGRLVRPVLAVQMGRAALHQLAHQGRREADVQQALRQAGLHGLALQLLHEGQGAEALLDQALHRTQLVHHVLLVAAGAAGHVGQLRHGALLGGQADLVAQHGRIAARRLGGRRLHRGALGVQAAGAQRLHGGLRALLAGRAHADQAFRRRQLGRGRRHLHGIRLAAQFGRATLEHALADVVLEAQRAHGQGLDIGIHGLAEGRLHALVALGHALCEAGAAGHRGHGSLRRAGLHASRAAGLGARCRSCHALDLRHALGGHGQHLHAFGAGLVGQHDGVVAKGLAHQREGLAGCTGGEAFDVHAASWQGRASVIGRRALMRPLR